MAFIQASFYATDGNIERQMVTKREREREREREGGSQMGGRWSRARALNTQKRQRERHME